MQSTIVQDAIAIIMTIWVCYANYKNIVVTPDILLIWKVAIGVFFSDKTGITDILRTGLKNKITKVVPIILFALLFLSSGTARADIFNPIPHNPATKAFLNSVNGTTINGNLLSDFTQIVNYLGAKEGRAYNFNAKKWVTTSGASVITYAPWNVAIDADLLNTDGFGGSIDWNIGQFLPVQNVPVMQYTQYLSIFGGAGAENDSNSNLKFASYVGIQFKLTFGS